MIRALIFDCFGVLVLDSAIGEHRDEAMLDFVAAQRQGCKTALLSNISRQGISRRFTADELSAYFDTVVVSGDEGVAKPDPAIFLRAVQRLGVQPHEAIMIDDLAGHCAGAREAGLQAIQYRSLAQLRTELAGLTDTQ